NAMNHPASTMPNPYGGEVHDGTAYGLPGEVVLGKGLSEQKAPLAAILLALEAILASRIDVTGRIVFLCCVSGETGRHDAIRCLLEETGVRAEMALLNGTGNRISLGNRGRVDVSVTVDGAPDPASGKPWRAETRQGAFMYPSLVAADSGVVRALVAASEQALGVTPRTYYASNAFDQGYLNHIGIEACTYGPGEEKYAHTDLDMASVDRTRDAARVYAALIVQRLT